MDNGLDPFPSTKAGLKTGRRSVKRGKRKTGPPPPESLPNSEVPSQSTSTMTPSSGSENAFAPKNTQKMDMPEKSSPQKKYDRRRKLVSTSKKMKGLTPEQAEIRRLRDNENERRRQHVLNAALTKLSVLLPSDIQTGFKKNSRHHILDGTLQYIRHMTSLVNDFNLKVKKGEASPPPNSENIDLDTDALQKAKLEAEQLRQGPKIRKELEDDEGIADRPYPARPMMPSNHMNVCNDTENTLEVPQCVLGPQIECREPAPFNGYPEYSSNVPFGPNPSMAPCGTTDITPLNSFYPQVADFHVIHDQLAIPVLPALTSSLDDQNFAYSSTPEVPYFQAHHTAFQSAQSTQYYHPAAGRYPCQSAMARYPNSEPIEGAMLPPQQCGSSLLFQEVDIGYCGRDYRRVSNESDSTNQSPATLTPNSSPTYQGNMAAVMAAVGIANFGDNENASHIGGTNEDLCSLAEFAANNSLSWP